MTLHVVLGDGEAVVKEVKNHLANLEKQADDKGFWFLVQAKDEPNATDTYIMELINEKEFYFETVGDTKGSPIYADSQDHHQANRLVPAVLEVMEKARAEGEAAILLTLFSSDDPDAPEDRWLNDVIESVVPAGFPCFALNDGMLEITIEEDDLDEGEEEGDEPAELAPPEPEPVADKGRMLYTREELEGMMLSDLKKIAADRGIEIPPRSRSATYINEILGEGAPEAEVTEPEAEPEPEPAKAIKPAQPTTYSTGNASAVVTSSVAWAKPVPTTARTMVLLINEGVVTSLGVDAETFQRVLDVLTQ